jgi:hypothetical protein
MNVRALPICKNPVGEGANLTLSIWKAQYNKGRGRGRTWSGDVPVRYAQDEDPMYLPSADSKQQVNAAVSEVVNLLAPDVVQIRYDIGRDWSGDWAIFFRVLLSDEASRMRLREVTTQVVRRLAERLDFPSMGLFAYHNFRSVSEQADLREAAWA